MDLMFCQFDVADATILRFLTNEELLSDSEETNFMLGRGFSGVGVDGGQLCWVR